MEEQANNYDSPPYGRLAIIALKSFEKRGRQVDQ